MNTLEELLKKNKKWSNEIKLEDPNFFKSLSSMQRPKYLWIGCADSRVPANQILGLMPGEVFVHRNIANQVIHTDLNCLSVIQFAVEVLKISEIIVCGHYGCGGIDAALKNEDNGLVDNWLRHIRDTYRFHQNKIDSLSTHEEKVELLVELNVLEQLKNVANSSIVQTCWKNNVDLFIHGCVYSLQDGIIKDLKISISNNQELQNL